MSSFYFVYVIIVFILFFVLITLKSLAIIISNNFGLINLNIGEGSQISPSSLSSINWSTGPYFIETAIDLTGTFLLSELVIYIPNTFSHSITP